MSDPAQDWQDTPGGVSLLTRVNLLILLLTLGVGVAAVFITANIVGRQQRDLLERRGELVATLQAGNLSLPLWEFDQKSIEHIERSMMMEDPAIKGVRVSGNGNDASSPPVELGNLTAARGILAIERPISQTDASGAARAIGQLRLAYSTEEAETATRAALMPVVGLLLVSLVAAMGLVSGVLHLLVLRPLARLTRSAVAIASGQYGTRLPPGRRDEIGRLTSAFNHMAATVQGHTSTLEQRVTERTEALRRSHEVLEATNRQIMDSIRYARLIQAAILPKPETLKAHGVEAFVLWQPRDVVGGDFYVMKDLGEAFLAGVIDCTGHGVPGAFMTMTVNTVLDHVAGDPATVEPGAVLGAINRRLRVLLHQGEEANGMDNGLDIGLCYCRPVEGRLVFSGARIGLFVADEGEIVHWRGDPHSIGYKRSNVDFRFAEQSIELRPGRRFYLVSDGLLDQAGGAKGYGFGVRRLKELLLEIQPLPMALQLEALHERMAAYQGGWPQRDDITVIGFAVPALPRPTETSIPLVAGATP